MRVMLRKSVARAICKRWGLPCAAVSKAHKYIARWAKNGHWSYRYPCDQQRKTSRRSAKLEVALKTTPITGIQPLVNPTQQDVEREIEKLKRLSREGKLVCPALGGRNVCIEKMTATHLKRTRGKKRLPSEYAAKVKYLPFVQEILKHGKISEKSYRGKGVPEQKRLTYGVICLVKYSDMENGKIVKKTEAAEVAVAYDKHKDLFVLSFASYDMKKALPFKTEPSGCLTVVSPASLRATIPLRVDMFRSKTPISSQSLMQPSRSIPQPPKKASEISRFTVKKSVAKAICKRWGLPCVLKSVKTRRERFLEIKAALLKHCRQKLREAQAEEAALRKAIIGWERLEKAGAGKKREKADNGTIRTWGNGKKYRRVAPGKWVRVYQGNEEAESKGGVRAWKNIIKKLNAIDDERELMWFVQQNRMRFIDNAGYPLNVVEQLSELASARNDEIVARKDAAAKERMAKLQEVWRKEKEEAKAKEAKSLEDAAHVIKENKFKEKLADMTAKVDDFLSEEHTEKELNDFQKNNTKPLLQDLKNAMDTFSHGSKGYNKIRWIYSRVDTLDNRVDIKAWEAYEKDPETIKRNAQWEAEQRKEEIARLEPEIEKMKAKIAKNVKVFNRRFQECKKKQEDVLAYYNGDYNKLREWARSRYLGGYGYDRGMSVGVDKNPREHLDESEWIHVDGWTQKLEDRIRNDMQSLQKQEMYLAELKKKEGDS